VFAVFGTEVEVQLRDTVPARAQAAYADVGTLLQRLHRELHPWEEGELTALNRSIAAGGTHTTTLDLAALIEASQRLETATEGAFNPAIGALVELWGFHTSNYPITDPPPAADPIDALVAHSPSTRDLVLEELEVRSANSAVQLDFSGIAKGLAVRRVCEVIDRHSVGAAMVNAGGDVMVCSAGRRPWRVAVRAPGGGVLETIEVDRPLAVFTSGNYYRYGDFDGERYAHILDPSTGRPVSEIVQATVIDSNPMTADAGATALVVAGADEWERVADLLDAETAIVIDADGAVSRLDKRRAGRR